MKKTNRNTLIFVVVLILAVFGAYAAWQHFAPDAYEGDKLINVSITHANGNERNIELATDAEYLWDAMIERDLIDGADSEFGKWITTVDGEVADEANGQYWLFTKGGEWVTTSCDTTPIADGESYEFFIYGYEG